MTDIKNVGLKALDANVRNTVSKINECQPGVREKMTASEQKVYDRYVKSNQKDTKTERNHKSITL